MRACDVMTADVVTVTAETSVKTAADLLASHGFTALPVVNTVGAVIGIVSELDLLRNRFPRDARYLHLHMGHQPSPADTVGQLMSTPAIAVNYSSDIVDVVELMHQYRLRSLPVVREHRLVGILTRRDLVRSVARADDEIARDVKHRLAMYGGPERWTVAVHDGCVEIHDEFDDETGRHVATVLAEGVPGVTEAHASGPEQEEPTP